MDLSIRDENGKWKNSAVFRQEAIKFMKNKRYCIFAENSVSFMDYWEEQLKRCQFGYEIGGHRITGDHYNYLNFTEIEIVPDTDDPDAITAVKETKCPDFWDGDYDYFWCLDIAKNGLFSPNAQATSQEEKTIYRKITEDACVLEGVTRFSELTEIRQQLVRDLQKPEKQKILDRLKLKVKPHMDFLDGGNHMIVGKSRRKGYSYKNAAICSNTYNTIRKSITLIGAFDKKYLYPKGTMGMASNYLSFINKYTAWGKGREYVDKQEHRKASFEKRINGIKVESGYQSEIIALTFADNPDAARGKDAKYVLFEEAGVFPNLKASYVATQPGLTAGRFTTGQILVFGTGGDMESGTADFAEMFYNPIQFGLMPFSNIWDENAEQTYCGFFHPVYMNMEGFYDEQGNSNTRGALDYELGKRAFLTKNSTSSLVLQARVQEYPVCPSEAFLTISLNDFPIVELRARYSLVKRENLHLRMGQPCYLKRDKDSGKIKAVPDLTGELQPLWDYNNKSKDTRGSVVVYEYPVVNPPKGLYKIGFDPYRQVNGLSMACIYVYKSSHKFSYSREQIVAQYVGRPYDPSNVNRIAWMLAELYNTEVMHENEVTHVKGDFEKWKKLHLLAAQPDAVIGKNVSKSGVNRIYGIHMVEKLKDAGEKYIKAWLLQERDVDSNGKVLTNIDFIYDPALLEELMYYNRKGNYDRVMALMMVMFQIEEDGEPKEYGENKKENSYSDLVALMNRQYTNLPLAA